MAKNCCINNSKLLSGNLYLMKNYSQTLFYLNKIKIYLLTAALLPFLTACDPVSLTALGVGSSTGVNHAMNGIAYRTFALSTSQVKRATIAALGRMQIKVESTRKEKSTEIIVAKTPNRNIEISVEALSPNTTRMRAVAKDGLFYDSSTASEIVFQTEKVLGA